MRLQDTRAIVRLSWPMLVAQVAVLANGVADTVMTGHYHATHLAAVGIGASIYITVFVTLMGVLQGLSPIVARCYGAGERKRIGLMVRQGAWLALALSVPGVALLAFPAPVLELARVPAEVLPLAQDYLRACAYGLPAILLARVFYALAPAVGRPRAVMAINLVALAVKIPLSYALLHGLAGLPELGAVGCAVASAVEFWLMFALALWMLGRDPYYREFRVFEGSARPDWRALKAILRLGVPIGLTMLVEVTSFTFMALFLARLGAVVSGAHQIVANLAALFFMLPLSLGTATMVLLGQALGRRDTLRAREMALAGLRLAGALSLLLSFTVLALKGPVVHFYTGDPAVQALALSLLPLLALFHAADAVQTAAVHALRGYHHTLVPMLIYVGALWGIGLGGGYWLAFEGLPWPLPGLAPGPLGAAGMWLAGALSLLAAGAGLLAYLLRVSRHALSAP